jgi:myo-inositol-1(or 4)-monophosphatase
MSVTDGASLAQARIAGPRSIISRLTSAAPDLNITPRVHSLALRFARVAQGTLDVAIAGPDSHDWDLAAADLLVHEAGGALTRVGGGKVLYNCPEPRHGILLAAGRDRLALLNEYLGDERLASL